MIRKIISLKGIIVKSRIAQIFSASFMLFSLTAANADGYISWKEGVFKDHSTNFDVEYEKNKGRFREVSFEAGNEKLAQRLSGDLRFNKENKLVNFGLGLVLSNDDQIFIRSTSIKDRLIDKDSNNTLVGNIDAKSREIGYARDMGGNDAMSLMFLYGVSTLPTYYDVENNYFIDLAPRTQYLTVGIRRDEMRSILRDPDKKQGGYQWYFDGDMSFGIIRQETSNKLYNMGLYNINQAGIQNQVGYDLVTRAWAEFGPAYIIHGSRVSGAASVGVFAEYALPWASGLLPINTTSTGQRWGLGAHMGWGFNARLALNF